MPVQMAKVRTHRFNGVKYRLDFSGSIDGVCDNPLGEPPTIFILADINTKNGLETVLHESLHAENWSISEEKVDRIAREIADLLWRLGFRRKK